MISHKNLFGISKNRFFHEISFVNDITLRFAAFFISYGHTVLKDSKMTLNWNLYIMFKKAITLQISFMTTVNQTKKKKDGVNNAMKQNRPLKMDARIEMRTKGIKSNKIIILLFHILFKAELILMNIHYL